MFVTCSHLTRVELDANRTITTGSIRVNSIWVSNATAGAVTVQFVDNAGTKIISVSVPANDSKLWTGPAMFSNGLVAQSASSSSVSATVAHSADGA